MKIEIVCNTGDNGDKISLCNFIKNNYESHYSDQLFDSIKDAIIFKESNNESRPLHFKGKIIKKVKKGWLLENLLIEK